MAVISHLLIGIAVALSVAAFLLALWPAVADAPWETQGPVTMEFTDSEPQLTNDALRLKKCHTRLKYMEWDVVLKPVPNRIFHDFLDLGCLDLVGLEIPVDVFQDLCKEYVQAGIIRKGCPSP